ncbi:hypothetical protein K7X08_023152 [Anisodus acutangulus]|uniref:Uncharacterized protein n=1 Tax=Anisodus acutangulus TaxID=402998 RepID=A0A9Q1LEB5_9SOLA|nr:hypothetical protein K7X08_023152 [Anisodus acutangulus]
MFGNKWVKDYGMEWYASFKARRYHSETPVDEAILRAHHSDIWEQLAEIYEQSLISLHALILFKRGQPFEEPVDEDFPTPKTKPHVEPASNEETEAAAQVLESDSDDGDTDNAPKGSEDEKDDDDQSADTTEDANYVSIIRQPWRV